MTLSQIGIVLILVGYLSIWFLYFVDITTNISVKHFKWIIIALTIIGAISIAGIGLEIYDSYNKIDNTELINNE